MSKDEMGYRAIGDGTITMRSGGIVVNSILRVPGRVVDIGVAYFGSEKIFNAKSDRTSFLPVYRLVP